MKAFLLKKIKFFILILAVIALAIWLLTLDLEGENLQFVLKYGYAGFFGISFIGGLNIISPLPHLIFIPLLLEAGLNPLLLGVIAAIATSLADAIGYILGKAGSEAFKESLQGFQRRAKNIIEKYPRLMPLILFLWAAVIPLPNEILVIPAGISGYGIFRILGITVAGNFVFNIIAIQLGSTLFM